ncbi:MAG: enoyl-CoA hydratase/isomerase family protein [Betaproteobacteria bacterium]
MRFDETTVLLRKENGTAVVTLNRPEVLNAMDDATMRLLKDTLEDLADDASVRVLIITGAGDRAFCAGSDIKELSTMDAERMRYHSLLGQGINRIIESMPKPVIAAVNGYAVGGGCELALACDIRIASRSAKFGFPEVNVGSVAGAGGIYRLARIVGVGIAKELLLFGNIIDAEEAYRLNLVNRLVPQGESLKVAMETATEFLKKSPVSVQLTKACVNKSFDVDWETGALLDSLTNAFCGTTEEFVKATRAFLNRKGK